jgi:hypothetical protein
MIRYVLSRVLAIAIVVVGLVILWSSAGSEPMRGHPIGQELDEP